MIAASKKKPGPPAQGPPVSGPQEKEEVVKEEAMESPKQEAAEHSMDGKYVPPESVGYHDGSEKCGVCEYNTEDGCTWLGFQVDDEGHCSLFGEKESE